ncbi:homoserine kinase, partial [uncultured Peptoniphilus sp.]|uniref:homoserine kinase n=1 Tax=uncultured Peptoniphilus sp. TaxID=254354 RepID=UPI002806204E
ATCIVAGLYAAKIILGEKYSKDEILRFATDIEGHPDNVGPAILGGLVISAMENDRVFYYKINPSKKLSYILIIPDFELETSLARSILPKKVTREDAVYNIARSNLISRAIEKGDMEMLIGIFGDKLHEPYRKKLIKDFDLYEKIARENKATIFISGAGSSMLIISSKENLEILNKLRTINENYKIMELSSGGGAEIIGKDF